MSTALYRRYRPDSFADVIGQEHVTGPLMQALRSNRVNHAYLFSGPRGCGKTTSARILARILNCHENTEQTPRDTPCGTCPSCVDLATGAAGSLDVVEIDAASHGGVDDARELRERATFSPSRDRFKIFILDEAHMVTPQGFNALLKIVEEPPEYLKFIFATTEPDKVIGTIRSRTHHYPFRLIPPDVLAPYVEQLCQQEGVQVGGGVMPLVVRAGGGSARDTLSVMDQLIAGSEGGTVDYELAVALLGYTHATLLDDVVDGLAARDGGSIFRVVDRVIDSGHEPRRFVEDLLERLRDLIVIAVSGEGAGSVLRGLPADQMERMRLQATNLGISELSRAADLANAALTEMSGATSPRLHLELLCARLLLPAADDAMTGVAARLDRLERGLVAAPAAAPVPVGGTVPGAPASAAPSAASTGGPIVGSPAVGSSSAGTSFAGTASAGAPAVAAPVGSGRGAAAARQALAAAGSKGAPSGAAVERTAEPAAEQVSSPAEAAAAPVSVPTGDDLPPWDIEPPHEDAAPSRAEREIAPVVERAPRPGAAPASEVAPAPEAAPTLETTPVPGGAPAPGTAPELAPATSPESAPAPEPEPAPAPEPVPASEREPAAAAVQDSEMLRRRWPEVLETLSNLKRATWVLVKDNAQVAELSATTLRLTFGSAGLATTFRTGPHAQLVQQAVHETLGFEVKVEGGVEEGRPAARETASAPLEEPDPGLHDPFESAQHHTDEPARNHTGEPEQRHLDEPAQHRESSEAGRPAPESAPARGPSAAAIATDSVTALATPPAAAPPAASPAAAPPAASPAAAATPPAAASRPAAPAPDPQAPVTDWEVVPVGSYDPPTASPSATTRMIADPAAAAPTTGVRGAVAQSSHGEGQGAPDNAGPNLATQGLGAPSLATQKLATPSPAAVTRTATVASPEVAPLAASEVPGQHLTGAQAAKAALAARQAGAYGNTRAAASASPADDGIPDADVPPSYDEEPPYAEDSVDFSETALMGVPLVAQLLGAKVITEIVEGQA